MSNYVGHRTQAFFTDEEIVNVLSYSFQQMSYLVFVRHPGVNRFAELQYLLNVRGACLTRQLRPLRKGLLGSLLLGS